MNVKNFGAKGNGIVKADGAMSAATSVTVTAGTGLSGFIAEFSGVAASPVNVSSTAHGSNAAPTSAPVTTTLPNTTLLTIFGFDSSGTFSTSTPPTQLGLIQWSASNQGEYGGYQTIAPSGPTSAVVGSTGATSGDWGALSIALSPSGTSSPAFVSVTSIVTNNAGTLPIQPPAASKVGNLQVLCIVGWTSATTPAGWTHIANATNSSLNTDCYYKFVTAINPGSQLTSASSTFTAADVGKLICVDQTSTTVPPYAELCGTIFALIDANDVQLTILNQHTSLTSAEFVYATNDDTAIQAAVTAFATSTASTLYFPRGVYGATTEIHPSSSRGIIITGDAGGFFDFNGNVAGCPQAKTPSSTIAFLTKSLTGANGIHLGDQLSLAQQIAGTTQLYRIMNLGVVAGVGCAGHDGGGATVEGIHLDHVTNAFLDGVFESGFGGDGIAVDGSWEAHIDNSFAQNNGHDGIIIENTGSGGGDSQNTYIANTQVSFNNNNGINVSLTSYPTVLINDTLQWNNQSGGSFYQLNASASGGGVTVIGCWIDGTLNPAPNSGSSLVTYIGNHSPTTYASIFSSGIPLSSGGSASLTPPQSNYVCTGTCTITLPAPATGNQYCVRNADNVATVITLGGQSGVFYEATAWTGYGTSGATMTSGGAVGDRICLVALDATHWLVDRFVGTWTAH